jgi:hypothetical protein
MSTAINRLILDVQAFEVTFVDEDGIEDSEFLLARDVCDAASLAAALAAEGEATVKSVEMLWPVACVTDTLWNNLKRGFQSSAAFPINSDA